MHRTGVQSSAPMEAVRSTNFSLPQMFHRGLRRLKPVLRTASNASLRRRGTNSDALTHCPLTDWNPKRKTNKHLMALDRYPASIRP